MRLLKWINKLFHRIKHINNPHICPCCGSDRIEKNGAIGPCDGPQRGEWLGYHCLECRREWMSYFVSVDIFVEPVEQGQPLIPPFKGGTLRVDRKYFKNKEANEHTDLIQGGF